MSNKPLLTLSEAARELGVSPAALRGRAARGTLALEVLQARPGSRHYVRRADLERLVGRAITDHAA